MPVRAGVILWSWAPPPDSLLKVQDTIAPRMDTVSLTTISPDTMNKTKDSIPSLKISKKGLEKIVDYHSEDSILIDVKRKKVYLYTEAVTKYEDMELDAQYIEIDFQQNELYASGIADTVGKIWGHPVFKQDVGEYHAREIKYNFTTKKGKISHVITTEGEGYIHGEQIKKLEDYSYIKSGKYTTCELEHPHFEIAFTKAKVIPNDKIITGPAYLSFGDVPTFLAIPFGFFPNQKGRASGFLMPKFGETANMGFGFEGIGFYFGFSDNIDLALTADIFTRGSWAVRANSNYVFRYKCNGRVEMSYARTLLGERYTSSFSPSSDFKVYWTHQQDAKSHPTTRFSAHVNFVTSNYNKYNPSSAMDYLSNQYASKISFSTNAGGVFFLDAAFSYDQNTQTHNATVSLPDVNMYVNQFYPFRKKNKTGTLKWWDNIALQWRSSMSNQMNTIDSNLKRIETWRQTNIGMKHNIPLSIPIKLGKFNWNTSVNFNEIFYLQNTRKEFSVNEDTVNNLLIPVVTDIFSRGFYPLHDLSLSSAFSTKVYFMYLFKQGALLGIRHVMTPNISFTYRPGLNKESVLQGYYHDYINDADIPYSFFQNTPYGVPSLRTQALASISLSNNVEMKIKSKKDTITGSKKIVILDNLSISTQYDFAADSLQWQPLVISARTVLFKQINITANVNFDPYCINEQGQRVNKLEINENKQLFRLSSTSFNLGVTWTLDGNTFNGKSDKKRPANQQNMGNLSQRSLNSAVLGSTTHADFSNPWSFTFNYSFDYNLRDDYAYYRGLSPKKYTNAMIHTVNIMGDFNITRKWKVGVTTGYDIVGKELTYTKLDIYRDLHCWEMHFEWVPFGFQKGWSFTINVKASVLQDLKYNLKKDFRDYM
jgi:lipopolysaccharide assembly outer membrane protein LptD (OstA)